MTATDGFPELRTVTFTVPGVAQPAGSKRAFNRKGGGRPIVTDDNPRAKPWQAAVAAAAAEKMTGELLDGPLELHVYFHLTRPKGHFRTGKKAHLVRDTAPIYPTVRPDITKMLRAVEDALTGVVWRDDAQVVHQVAAKRYAPRAETTVTVHPSFLRLIR